MTWPLPSRSMNVAGSFVWRGTPVNVRATGINPVKLFQGEAEARAGRLGLWLAILQLAHFQGDQLLLSIAPHFQPHGSTRAGIRYQTLQLLHFMHRSSSEIEDHIATLQPCTFGGAVSQNVSHEHPTIFGDIELASQF